MEKDCESGKSPCALKFEKGAKVIHMFTLLVIGGVIIWACFILMIFFLAAKYCGKLLLFLLVKLYDIGRYFLGMEPRRDYDGMLFPHR